MAASIPEPGRSVDERAAPYHSGRQGSIRAIQRGAAELRQRLMHTGRLSPESAAHLRAGDVDLDRLQVQFRDFDGTVIGRFSIDPSVAHALRLHLAAIRLNYERDRIQGMAGVWVPPAIRATEPDAGESWSWFWLFPARHVVPDPASGRPWRPAGAVPGPQPATVPGIRL
ncbi:MAG: hypothetical protein R3F07_09695 [Opitutaceae bacterium]